MQPWNFLLYCSIRSKVRLDTWPNASSSKNWPNQKRKKLLVLNPLFPRGIFQLFGSFLRPRSQILRMENKRSSSAASGWTRRIAFIAFLPATRLCRRLLRVKNDNIVPRNPPPTCRTVCAARTWTQNVHRRSTCTYMCSIDSILATPWRDAERKMVKMTNLSFFRWMFYRCRIFYRYCGKKGFCIKWRDFQIQIHSLL